MTRAERIATLLVVVSCALYAAILGVPFVADSTSTGVTMSASLAVAGEGTFWLGALIAGPTLMRRYRRKLSPRNWFRRPAEQPVEGDSV